MTPTPPEALEFFRLLQASARNYRTMNQVVEGCLKPMISKAASGYMLRSTPAKEVSDAIRQALGTESEEAYPAAFGMLRLESMTLLQDAKFFPTLLTEQFGGFDLPHDIFGKFFPYWMLVDDALKEMIGEESVCTNTGPLLTLTHRPLVHSIATHLINAGLQSQGQVAHRLLPLAKVLRSVIIIGRTPRGWLYHEGNSSATRRRRLERNSSHQL